MILTMDVRDINMMRNIAMLPITKNDVTQQQTEDFGRENIGKLM